MLISYPNASVINYTPDHAMAPMESLRIEIVLYDNKPALLAVAIASQFWMSTLTPGAKAFKMHIK